MCCGSTNTVGGAVSLTTTLIKRPSFQNDRRSVNVMANTKFLKIRCNKCKNEQITFGKSATTVKCLVCGEVLAEPTGGKTKVTARVLEVLE
jgi:small subunit ribosomal protein S27e